MVRSIWGHIQFNVSPQNLAFYKDLFTFLGWPALEDSSAMLGVGRSVFHSLWFFSGANDSRNDYDGRGMNHLGLLVESAEEVDQTVEYLCEHAATPLFDTPRQRPEFSSDAAHPYYQVMFESPDRILFEVVHMAYPIMNWEDER